MYSKIEAFSFDKGQANVVEFNPSGKGVMMMGKKAALLVMAIALVAGLGVGSGCTAEKGTATIDQVPQRANFAAGINLERIFADQDVLNLIDEIGASLEEPKTVDELLAEVEQATGIDLRDFTEVVIFGDVGSEGYFGAIVKVDETFIWEALINSIEGALGEEMATTDYNGYQLYTLTVEANEVALCFSSDDSFVCGSVDAVKDVIDVGEGASQLGGPVYEAYDALGDAWFKVAAEVPAEAIAELGEVPEGFEAFQDIQVAGFSFNKEGANLSFLVKLLFPTSAAAADAAGTINTLKDMLIFVPDIPDEVANLVSKLGASQSGSWVTLSLQTTMAELRAVGQALQEMEGIVP